MERMMRDNNGKFLQYFDNLTLSHKEIRSMIKARKDRIKLLEKQIEELKYIDLERMGRY